MMWPRKLWVGVDDLEQRPGIFQPGKYRWEAPISGTQLVQVGVHSLPLLSREGRNRRVGDYTLLSGDKTILKHEDRYLISVERKGSWSEVENNFFGRDSRRAANAFKRWRAESIFCLLWLDFPLKLCEDTERNVDRLFGIATAHRVPVLWMPPRRDPRVSGEIVLRWMLQAYGTWRHEHATSRNQREWTHPDP
jgi:hypothetical protein